MIADRSHILIVDDDERIRGLLQQFLIKSGFLVTSARDAEHARRILSGLEFELIVLPRSAAADQHADPSSDGSR